MKRVRTQGGSDSSGRGDDSTTGAPNNGAGGGAIAAVPVPEAAAAAGEAIFSPAFEAFAASISAQVPQPLITTRYVPTAFNIPAPPDPMDTVRKVLYEGIRVTNMAAGWVARWPGPVAGIDVLMKFSSDLCTFFYSDVNTASVVPDLARRTTFLLAIHALRTFFETHRQVLDEFLQADRAMFKFRRNRVTEIGDHILASLRATVPPQYPENFTHEIHSYAVHLEAVMVRWHTALAKTYGHMRELVSLLDRLRALLLAEVPAQVRELLWPGE